MNYVIWIVSPYSHSQAFTECAQSLQAAFIELGYGCDITTSPPVRRENVVILGAHLLHPDDMSHFKEPFIWQLEQIPGDTDEERSALPLTDTYLRNLRNAEVWDYSRVNIASLRKLGVEAKLLEVGYSKCLTRIENVPYPDIDFLHIGSMNQRRAHVLQGLQASGAKVAHLFDCYGVKRDVMIARAKIVLNVHYYEAKIWEIVRCSYLMANRKCIVSEVGLDVELEKPYYGAIVFAGYDNLVEKCLGLLGDDGMRKEWEQAGFERMRERSQVEYLKRVLL